MNNLLLLFLILLSGVFFNQCSNGKSSTVNEVNPELDCNCLFEDEMFAQLKQLPDFKINRNFKVCSKNRLYLEGINIMPAGKFYVLDCVHNKKVFESINEYEYQIRAEYGNWIISLLHNLPDNTEPRNAFGAKPLLDFILKIENGKLIVSEKISYEFPKFNENEIISAIKKYKERLALFNTNPTGETHTQLIFNILPLYWCVLNGSIEAQELLEKHLLVFTKEKISKFMDYDMYDNPDNPYSLKNRLFQDVELMLESIKIINSLSLLKEEMYK
ncbi:MAG: hypothetical protein HN381_14645 [Bacteroidetes bacterium]|jgi:hypothetical protein|nr:hypothetical protein [Bacteroidota bacterium]